ncbi:hypothetical protein CKY51_15460 [Xanthomonas maliensis]|nr:hypothetical protein CKY51_15460 [Xanthomonas maliensis]
MRWLQGARQSAGPLRGVAFATKTPRLAGPPRVPATAGSHHLAAAEATTTAEVKRAKTNKAGLRGSRPCSVLIAAPFNCGADMGQRLPPALLAAARLSNAARSCAGGR